VDICPTAGSAFGFAASLAHHRQQPVRAAGKHQHNQAQRQQDRGQLCVNPGRLARQPAEQDEQSSREAKQQQ